MVPNSKPSYARTVEQAIRLHLYPFFGDADLRTIGAEAVERFKAQKTRTHKPKTVNNLLGILSKLFSSAVAWRYCEANPVSMVRKLRVPTQEMRFWTRAQSDRFLGQMRRSEPGWCPLFLCALRTGMRLGELIALRWQDVDFERAVVQVNLSFTHGRLGSPKSGRSRELPMTDGLKRALRAHRERADEGELVFRRLRGGRLSRDAIKHPFRRATKAAGLPVIRIHDMRHSFASQLAMAGTPMPVLKAYMGHADIKTTMRYAHLSPEARTRYIHLLEGGRPAPPRDAGAPEGLEDLAEPGQDRTPEDDDRAA